METAQKKKLLLVEDDPLMIDLLVKEFMQSGFEVIEVKTGNEAIVKFEEMKPDVIVLDIILPDMNGFEALRQIRRKPAGPEAKVVILSNLSETPTVEEAKRLGAAEYLVKTHYSLPEIVEKIRAVL